MAEPNQPQIIGRISPYTEPLILIFQAASGAVATSGRVLQTSGITTATSGIYTFDYSGLTFFTSGAYTVATGTVNAAITGNYVAYQWGNASGWSLPSPYVLYSITDDYTDSLIDTYDSQLINLESVQGDSFTYTITLTDASDEALQLYNYSASGFIRKSAENSTIIAQYTGTIDAVNGEITFYLDKASAANLNGKYRYDFQIMSDTTGKLKTIAYGTHKFIGEVTR